LSRSTWITLPHGLALLVMTLPGWVVVQVFLGGTALRTWVRDDEAPRVLS
jgi:purine-cytosine permease-like protein